MIKERSYDQGDHDEVASLLIGRKVTKVADDKVVLDNGTRLRFEGNEGGCACSAGDYELTELNGTDNIITKVEFVDKPSSDEYTWCNTDEDRGFYKIFVYADNKKINLATFEGDDGNGYYGTGYCIHVLGKLGTFSGLVEDLNDLVEHNRDGDGEDVTLAVSEIVSRHSTARGENF